MLHQIDPSKIMGLFDSPDLALISVGGADSHELLNNIFTAPVPKATEQSAANPVKEASLNALCNTKGRVISLFYAIVHADGYLLVVPASLQERIIKLLKMYRLRAKVEIAKPEGLAVATVVAAPEDSEEGLAQDKYPLGALDEGEASRIETMISLAVGRRIPRTLIIAKPDDIIAYCHELGQHDLISNQSQLDLASVLDVVPWIEAEQSEAFLPQSLDLDHPPLSVCSLEKGCYPGQEIIARMHYLGKRKRALHGLNGNTALARGDRLYRCGDEDRAEQGTVINSYLSDQGQTLAFAEMAIQPESKPEVICDGNGNEFALFRIFPGNDAPKGH